MTGIRTKADHHRTNSRRLAADLADNAATTYQMMEERAEMLANETRRYRAAAQRLSEYEQDPAHSSMRDAVMDLLIAAGRMQARFEDVQTVAEGELRDLRESAAGMIVWPSDRIPAKRASRRTAGKKVNDGVV